MAEVGQRLWTRVYRLSAIKNSQSRAVSTGDSRAAMRLNCSVSYSRVKKEPTRNQGAVLPESEIRTTQRKAETFSRLNESQHLQQNGNFLCPVALDVNSIQFSRFVKTKEKIQSHRAALHQVKPRPLRMSSWTREAVSTDPDTFKFNQQLRALCTVFFILAGQQDPGCGQRRQIIRKVPPHPTSTSTRSYSWRSGRSSKDYYGILKVSPAATQSQIKTAYYKQSFIYHPDKNPGDKEASRHFIEIGEAYAVLGNISLRRKYDRGILIQTAVQRGSKEAASRSTGFTQQQQQQHHHYEQQRQQQRQQYQEAAEAARKEREGEMRARRARMQEEQREHMDDWVREKRAEGFAVILLSLALVIIVHLGRS